MLLDLKSPRWKELTQAYGSAGDIPELLKQLATAPVQKSYTDEPWYSLWSALCHQGDVYTATYAAIPHIIAIAEADSGPRRLDLLSLAVTCEAFRHKGGAPNIPSDLEFQYRTSIERLCDLVLEPLRNYLTDDQLRVLLAGIALSRGHARLGNVILSLDESFRCLNCEYNLADGIIENGPTEE
ncbi:MAG TPA: hypothetical protein VFU86_04520 [Terriglobales bacterium]|nr:hypothetical protein [Terriglobales bacterium]